MSEKMNFLENVWNIYVSKRPYEMLKAQKYVKIMDDKTDIINYFKEYVPVEDLMSKFREYESNDKELHNFLEFEAFKYGFYAGLEIGLGNKDFHF